MRETTPGIIDRSLLSEFGQPTPWLESREEYSVRFVNGLHNNSTHDKKKWVDDEPQSSVQFHAVRIVEKGTGREEIWNRSGFISVTEDGVVESHIRHGTKLMPAHVRIGLVSVWYQNGVVENPEGPAVHIAKIRLDVPHLECVHHIDMGDVQEIWEDGEWKSSTVGKIDIWFEEDQHNTQAGKAKVTEWFQKHCKSGFHPLREEPFDDPVESLAFFAKFGTY